MSDVLALRLSKIKLRDGKQPFMIKLEELKLQFGHPILDRSSLTQAII